MYQDNQISKDLSGVSVIGDLWFAPSLVDHVNNLFVLSHPSSFII